MADIGMIPKNQKIRLLSLQSLGAAHLSEKGTTVIMSPRAIESWNGLKSEAMLEILLIIIGPYKKAVVQGLRSFKVV